jgi:hypothetical protein
MSQVAVRIYDFSVALGGVDELTAEVADRLYESGCDDASPHSEGPTITLDFHREAESLGDAIASAVKNVERAGYTVVRIEVESADD